MEATSFVSPKAVPQLADASEIVSITSQLEGLDTQVLVSTVRHAERALTAGATHLSFVLSVSERHNQGNVRRSPLESVKDFHQMVQMMPAATNIRLNLATAFDCPHHGPIPIRQVRDLLDLLIDVTAKAEIALCDTTGKANPAQVAELFAAVAVWFPQVANWAFHGHDTYGLGVANVLAAWNSGVATFDTSAAGLGGCPFAPGATGNVATEDLVWMFEAMGICTGIDLNALVAVAHEISELPGSQTGGRVRYALSASASAAAD